MSKRMKIDSNAAAAEDQSSYGEVVAAAVAVMRERAVADLLPYAAAAAVAAGKVALTVVDADVDV